MDKRFPAEHLAENNPPVKAFGCPLFYNMSKKSLEILEDKSKIILTQGWKTVL